MIFAAALPRETHSDMEPEMMSDRLVKKFARILALLWLFPWPAAALAQAPFYQGKTVTIINGNEPGGTADMRMRAMMPYLKKYIPGEPTLLAEFMPGGGGRKLANHIYRGARPDGLTIGFPPGSFITYAVMGEKGVDYDVGKLIFLGSPESTTHYVFLTRKETGITGLDKLRAVPGLRVGAQSIGHTIYIVGRLFAYVLRLKDPKFVVGYSGPDVDNALLRGEVDARANIADTIARRSPEFIDKALVDFHAIVEVPKGDKHPRFSNLPELDRLARTERDRKLIDLFRSLRLVGSPYIVPPGTPRERVDALRAAFQKASRDPEFHKDFKKLVGDDPSPLAAEEIERAIQGLPREPSIIELFKEVTGSGPLPPS
jgi:tripartite-type tricarboxylate transporter receptor subunit TctC